MGTDELLAREAESWEAFLAQTRRVPPERWAVAEVVPGWSVHDLVWHCGRWTEYAAELMDEMTAGVYEDVPFPEAYWQGLNDSWAMESKLRSRDAVTTATELRRERARRALAALPGNADAEREFSSETFEHYDEHAAEIAAFADRLAADGTG
jgi:hypothetical protein